MITSKSSYYTSVIQVHSNDQTMLFTTVEKLREGSCAALPIVGGTMKWWLTVLLTFLVIKLLKYTKAWEICEHQLVPTPYVDDICSAEHCEFNEITEEDVKAFACKPMFKSCQLDPVLLIITWMIHMSLSSRVMPDPFKVAESHPALKKTNADHKQYSNFRPISK